MPWTDSSWRDIQVNGTSIGNDILNIVPANIQAIFHYPDTTNAGIIPYLNLFVGLKVFVGLSAIVIAFAGFKKFVEGDVDQ